MTAADYLQIYQQELAFLYQQDEIKSMFQLLCEDRFNWSRSHYLLHRSSDLHTDQLQVLDNALLLLKKAVPVQYITGVAHFYGNIYKVTTDTLIPRQETEELVAMIINDVQPDHSVSIIDIGTGTGCIAISLAQAIKSAQVSMLDVSAAALQVAQHNASRIGVNVRAIHKDVLELDQLAQNYDVIVSNPPYIRELEKKEIHDNVLDHEPHSALFVPDDDALMFYRKVLELAQMSLNKKGLVYFEINQYLPFETQKLAHEMGFQTQLFKDLNDNWRMMRCQKID